jgi:hypothetical protein
VLSDLHPPFDVMGNWRRLYIAHLEVPYVILICGTEMVYKEWMVISTVF